MHSFSNLGSCTAQIGTRCIWFHLIISLLDRIILSYSVLILYYNNFDLLIYIPCISTSWLIHFVKFNTTIIHQKLEKSEHTDKKPSVQNSKCSISSLLRITAGIRRASKDNFWSRFYSRLPPLARKRSHTHVTYLTIIDGPIKIKNHIQQAENLVKKLFHPPSGQEFRAYI